MSWGDELASFLACSIEVEGLDVGIVPRSLFVIIVIKVVVELVGGG